MDDPDAEQPTAQAPPEKAGGGTVGLNVEYIKSIPGILKFVEFFTLLIAFACGANFNEEVGTSWGRMDFFLFVTITGWIIVIIILILFVSNLISKINLNIDWNIPLVVFAVVMALLLLISSSLVADNVSQWSNNFVAARLLPLSKLRAAVAFGFISMFVFIGDAVVFFLKMRGKL